MNYKLKHLSKYCCKPANELEFEAVKMAAEIGGVDLEEGIEFDFNDNEIITVCSFDKKLVVIVNQGETKMSVLDFINKLRMTEEEARSTEEEAEKLEDDRVESDLGYNWDLIDNTRTFKALGGHKWRLSDDRKEVYLVKE